MSKTMSNHTIGHAGAEVKRRWLMLAACALAALAVALAVTANGPVAVRDPGWGRRSNRLDAADHG
ncbi:hypothetical protein [Amycolatopsis sp. NPDC051061]|uniref:hypothetical protein n=1 Tax=Amycolatopsis sp. NPDC051061 TaxID=3155042 RepID=UPI0034377C75